MAAVVGRVEGAVPHRHGGGRERRAVRGGTSGGRCLGGMDGQRKVLYFWGAPFSGESPAHVGSQVGNVNVSDRRLEGAPSPGPLPSRNVPGLAGVDGQESRPAR